MVFVDAHVHIYDFFHVDSLFDAAHDNFSRHARSVGCEGRFSGVLLLAETGNHGRFDRVLDQTASQGRGGPVRRGKWWASLTGEDRSAWLRTHDGRALLIIGGRQVVTRERLEVLCFFARCDIADHLPISETVARIVSGQGIAIVPWGFGKWTGKRGRIIANVFASQETPGFFPGDSANRPLLWPKPRVIRAAEDCGAPVLSGSDPLPLANQELRVGRFGTRVCCRLDPDQPARRLKEAFLDKDVAKQGFGTPVSSPWAIKDQLALRAGRGLS